MSRRARQLWMAGGITVLLAAGGATAYAWPQSPEAAPVPTMSAEAPGTADIELARWVALNEDLLSGDREKFISHGTGAARDALARWWDGTKGIGWTKAVASPVYESIMYLGVDFPQAPVMKRGTGEEDAGLSLLQGSFYNATWDGDVITDFTPYTRPMPWDTENIHVAKGTHVTVIGEASEAALVDATVAEADAAAETAFAQLAKLGATTPVTSFLVSITDDTERFGRWYYASDDPYDLDVAGFAAPALRPAEDKPWIPADIAIGEAPSGTYVAVGPLSSDDRKLTLVHEFIHVFHQFAAAEGAGDAPRAVAEGIAEWASTDALGERQQYTYDQARDAIQQQGVEAFSASMFEGSGDDPTIAYAAAASYFAFISSRGTDAWQVAVEAENAAISPVDAALKHDASLTPENWQAWMQTQ